MTRAHQRANDLRSSYFLTSLPDISIEDIAFDIGVTIQTRKLEGSDAALLVRNGRGVIVLSTSIQEEGRRRFAIAHELGHFLLHAKQHSAFLCTEEMFLQWYKSSPEEFEANTFAVEFLLPNDEFKIAANKRQLSSNVVSDIAAMFGTSLTSTLIRYVEIGPLPCALVAVKNGKLAWFKRSNDFDHKLRYEIRDRISVDTCAGDFFANGTIVDSEQQILQTEWLLNPTGDTPLMLELPFYLQKYGTVLSLLWF